MELLKEEGIRSSGNITSEEHLKVVRKNDTVIVLRELPAVPTTSLASTEAHQLGATQHPFNPEYDATAHQRRDLDEDGPDSPKVSAVYTGLVPIVYKAQRTLLTSLFESTGLAFLMIAVVMVLLLRSPSAGLLSMLPNVFPVVVVFGLMGWSDVFVDIGSMMTASVAMGVAVDDTIHFLSWFRRGVDDGMDRKDAILQAYKRVATAMTQTTAIGGIGLSIFAFSTFTPTQRFGTLMLALLAAALVGDLLFLPALLASPLGRVFDYKRRRSGPLDPTGRPTPHLGGTIPGRDTSEDDPQQILPMGHRRDDPH